METLALLAPPPNCALCPRLAAMRADAPPRPSLGPIDAEMLIVSGIADDETGQNSASQRIAHAVRCPALAGLPMPGEVATCNEFLAAEVKSMPRLRGVVAIGALAHQAVLAACGITAGRFRFTAGRIHHLPDGLLLANAEPGGRAEIEAVALALGQRITR